MESSVIRVFLYFQKKDSPNEGVTKCESFTGKAFDDDLWIRVLLNDKDFSECFHFSQNLQLAGWDFSHYYVFIENVYYKTNKIGFEYSFRLMSFEYQSKYDSIPLDKGNTK